VSGFVALSHNRLSGFIALDEAALGQFVPATAADFIEN
jgi:hypothetical protein